MCDPTEELAKLGARFAAGHCRGDSPLYERIPTAMSSAAMTFEGGTSRAHLLGLVHKHGAWLDWTGDRGESDR
ncbi:MAG TPA: hypothetical protein VNC61_16130 [Acidimicrobiales bacterium]|nr:hypothetical protein [Acidimicrobiales bacterium]